MAENGKIIRNGAEIQIDENGNVVARPAEGQELIVEDDARVGTLEAEQSIINEWPSEDHSRIHFFDVVSEDSLSVEIEDIQYNQPRDSKLVIYEFSSSSGAGMPVLEASFTGYSDEFRVVTKNAVGTPESDTVAALPLLVDTRNSSGGTELMGHWDVTLFRFGIGFDGAGFATRRGQLNYLDWATTEETSSITGSGSLILQTSEQSGETLTLKGAFIQSNRRDEA